MNEKKSIEKELLEEVIIIKDRLEKERVKDLVLKRIKDSRQQIMENNITPKLPKWEREQINDIYGSLKTKIVKNTLILTNQNKEWYSTIDKNQIELLKNHLDKAEAEIKQDNINKFKNILIENRDIFKKEYENKSQIIKNSEVSHQASRNWMLQKTNLMIFRLDNELYDDIIKDITNPLNGDINKNDVDKFNQIIIKANATEQKLIVEFNETSEFVPDMSKRYLTIQDLKNIDRYDTQNKDLQGYDKFYFEVHDQNKNVIETIRYDVGDGQFKARFYDKFANIIENPLINKGDLLLSDSDKFVNNTYKKLQRLEALDITNTRTATKENIISQFDLDEMNLYLYDLNKPEDVERIYDFIIENETKINDVFIEKFNDRIMDLEIDGGYQPDQILYTQDSVLNHMDEWNWTDEEKIHTTNYLGNDNLYGYVEAKFYALDKKATEKLIDLYIESELLDDFKTENINDESFKKADQFFTGMEGIIKSSTEYKNKKVEKKKETRTRIKVEQIKY
jgi:hypothetical protein